VNKNTGIGTRCVIITAQQARREISFREIRPGDFIVCADGGYRFAREAGIVPDAIVGDFDSCEMPTPGETDAEIVALPREKNETDTLACVRFGMSKGYEDFLMIGGLTGRADHTFANIQTLSYLTDLQCTAEIVDGWNRARMLDGIKKNLYQFMNEAEQGTETTDDWNQLTLPYRKDAYFSVFSYDEVSTGISIRHARYPLEDARLTQSYPIGVSNAFLENEDAEISVRRGRLLIMISEEGTADL
jgi:thiamine pyrophosphokinase